MFFFNGYFYYIIIALQIICVVHCLRKGNQSSWIWIIVFIPLVGCIAYIVTEIMNRNSLQQVQAGVGSIIYPAGKIKKLEQQLQFADTFTNRVQLADAYLSIDKVDKAILLYESSLAGAFTENEHVLIQLVSAYYATERYNDVLNVVKKVYKNPLFINSHANVVYAITLYNLGDNVTAEKEFLKMKIRYSYFEARYEYGLFLLKENRTIEAEKIFAEITGEFSYLSSFEKRNNKIWFNNAKDELKKINTSA